MKTKGKKDRFYYSLIGKHNEKKIEYGYENERLERIIRIVFSETRWFRPFLFVFCKERELIEDLRQTIFTIAWEAYLSGLSPDIDLKKICSLAQSGLYGFLKSFGLRKPKGTGKFISYEKEGIDEAIQAAQNKRIPIDIIFIGDDPRGRSFMDRLANLTGGRSSNIQIEEIGQLKSKILMLKGGVR